MGWGGVGWGGGGGVGLGWVGVDWGWDGGVGRVGGGAGRTSHGSRLIAWLGLWVFFSFLGRVARFRGNGEREPFKRPWHPSHGLPVASFGLSRTPVTFFLGGGSCKTQPPKKTLIGGAVGLACGVSLILFSSLTNLRVRFKCPKPPSHHFRVRRSGSWRRASPCSCRKSNCRGLAVGGKKSD